MDSSGVSHGIVIDDRNSFTRTQATMSRDYQKAASTGNPLMETTDGAKQPEEGDAQERLRTFWTRQMEEVQHLPNNEFKTQELPLARIKKIMKMDEDVKMISAEAPLLFSKAAQIFITELSLRAWVHTEESKRRTLQRNDIATAITKFDQFDFLIDIVPREELKPLKRTFSSGGTSEVQQYVYAVPQQQQATAASANTIVNSQTQPNMQSSALQSGQLLIAQQSQNGQPLTLTPINLDGAQLLQLAQSSQQIQSPQQTQAVVINPTSISNDQVVLQTQMQQQQDSTQTNEQKQQQSLQTALQQLLGSASSPQGEVHSLQVNAQGQLQLVKIINPHPHQQDQSQTENSGGVRQENTSQIYSLASVSEASGAQGTSNMNTMYVNAAESIL